MPGRVTHSTDRSPHRRNQSARPASSPSSQQGKHTSMAEHAPTRPKQGPASYCPTIEKKYGRSTGHWQQIIADYGLDKHMAIAGYLKSEHGMGHGHANALADRALAGNLASP